MGPKQIICSVCGKQVLKSTTLDIGKNQRACKDHPDTIQKAQKAQEELKQAVTSGRVYVDTTMKPIKHTRESILDKLRDMEPMDTFAKINGKGRFDDE